MGVKKTVKLTSLWDGRELFFESRTAASYGLHRAHAYLKMCEHDHTQPTDGITGEPFEEYIFQKPFQRKKAVRPQIQSTQLCNDCARAGGYCSWSCNLTPVKGWDAEAATDTSGNFYTWSVRACPLYMKDATTREGRAEQRRLLANG